MIKKLDVFDKTTGHIAVVGLPSDLAHLVQDGYGTMPHKCPTCQGTGKNPRAWEEMGNWDSCPRCFGSGEEPKMINWICCGNVVKPRAACPACGLRQTILKCARCGEDYANSPLAHDGICPTCVGVAMRAKVYAQAPFTLLYDNGTGYYDCASTHKTLTEAVKAAAQGWQTDQIITDDLDCQNVVWHSDRTCPKCGGTGKCSPDCTGDGRCICGGRGCPECG